jgi:hypothetical protein
VSLTVEPVRNGRVIAELVLLDRNVKVASLESVRDEAAPALIPSGLDRSPDAFTAHMDRSGIAMPDIFYRGEASEEQVTAPAANVETTAVGSEVQPKTTEGASESEVPRPVSSIATGHEPVTKASTSAQNQQDQDGLTHQLRLGQDIDQLLDELTPDTFDAVAQQMLEISNRSVTEKDGQTVRLVIKQIFDRREKA